MTTDHQSDVSRRATSTAGMQALFEDVDVFGGALHVVVLADDALHRLDVGVEGAVEGF